jgi:DNA gyrase subunit A
MPQEGLFAGNVENVELEEKIQRSYLDYAMSVIVGAPPDVRDGPKPVHRRILWSMLSPATADRRTASPPPAVGEVQQVPPRRSERVRRPRAQGVEWSLRVPLVHTTAPSVDGDPEAGSI